MQNGFVESFIGRLRDECLNEHLFSSFKEARHIEDWRIDYNTQRPHTSLNGLTPFALVNRSAMDHNPNRPGYDRGQQGGKVRRFKNPVFREFSSPFATGGCISLSRRSK